MGCGCKKKSQIPPPQVAKPAPPSRVSLKENVPPRPPQNIPPVQQRTVNEIVDKLDSIKGL